jgi:hypothetical protein
MDTNTNKTVVPDSPLVAIRGLKLEASTARGTAHILRGIDLDIGKPLCVSLFAFI